ncbi:C2H2 zinc finger transcription factor [Lithospermum erythrorhizon]|uniref:C2H2 zinc finger transcription factor n=1 Tax=Lithospermum erythrorhizon TaxID=34254 RepID=A0AAV3R2H3_LITER
MESQQGGPIVDHYNSLMSTEEASSYIGIELNDLNKAVGRRHHHHHLDVDEDDGSSNVDCMHDTHGSSISLHGLGVDEDGTSLDNASSSVCSSNILISNDVLPIETARSRFLDIIVDHFINAHAVQVEFESDFSAQCMQDKVSKRQSREIQYQGDARYVLPLMYIANMYETLVNEVNIKLCSLNGIREKTIGVALEAAGGLYRKLSKKFPRKGVYTFKRRELATSLETRSKFPELVIQEEKRVRFVVVNGLEIVENPTNIHIDDAEWFKRLTGRNEVAISARDYKFYAPRHKYRRVVLAHVPSISGLQHTLQTPSKHLQSLPHQALFHSLPETREHLIDHNSSALHYAQNHQCGPSSNLSDIAQYQQSTNIQQHMTRLPQLSHMGGRMHMMPHSPAKFCDECGTPYLRDASKFCSECGTKRLGT